MSVKRIFPYVLSVGLLGVIGACGSDDDDNGNSRQEEEAQTVTYRAVLSPLNGSGATGTATVKKDVDLFEVEVNMDGAPATVHLQHIYSGTQCATLLNDSNGDGFIDAVEAERVTGKALIPLDSDLRSRSGGGIYPVGRNYRYTESSSWETMVADLSVAEDLLEEETQNEFAIHSGPLSLRARVIEVHGTTVSLPGTVSGIYGLNGQRSLPIACGVLVEVPKEGNPEN